MNSNETLQTIERLRKENSAQESVLRGLRSDLLPRSFSIGGSIRVAPGASISYFHVKVERKWGAEFQTLCATPPSSWEYAAIIKKITQINAFLKEFETFVLKLSKDFLNGYLGEEDQSLAFEPDPVPNGVTIALLDCEERTQISIASKEQNAQYRLLAQQIAFYPEPLIFVSPRVIVSWKGRLMVVSADTIAASEPLTADECFELRTVMDTVSETLGFKKYFAGGSSAEEHKISGPPDATVVKGSDGRLYAHNIHALYPFFPPSRGSSVDFTKHKTHLRPELVSLSRSVVPLSPAAFVAFGASDSSQCNVEVRDAASHMCQRLIPNFVNLLLDKHPSDANALILRLHEFGINIGCLAVVYFYLGSPASVTRDPQGSKQLCSIVWTEMCARVLRDIIQQDMSHKIENSEVLESVGEVFSKLATNYKAYYLESIVPMLKHKFIGFATLTSEDPQIKNTKAFPFSDAHVNLTLLASRTMELIGGTLKPFGTSLPLSPSHYVVTSLNPKVKCLELPLPIIRKQYLSLELLSKLGPSCPLMSRLALLSTASGKTMAAEAKRYLISREEELASGFGSDMSNPQFNSGYILSCYDLAAGLNKRASSILGNLFPISISSVISTAASESQSPPKDGTDCASVALEIASVGIQLIRDSPLTGGGPSLLKALLKKERAIARVFLLGLDPKQFGEAIDDLKVAFKLLEPSVCLHGDTAPPPSVLTGGSIGGINSLLSPRAPPAGTLPANIIDDSLTSSIYALDISVMLSAMYTRRDQHDDAFPLISYSLKVCTALFGCSDERTISATIALSRNCMARRDQAGAEEHLRSAIDGMPSSGNRVMELSSLLVSLATIIDSKKPSSASPLNSANSGGATESDALHMRNIDIIEGVYGATHPFLAIAHSNYASSLTSRNRLAEADAHLVTAIAVLRKVHGTKPAAEVAETLVNIASLRKQQGKTEEAAACWLEALKTYEAVLPLSTRDIRLVPILENLAAWCKATNKHVEKDVYERRITAIKKANGFS